MELLVLGGTAWLGRTVAATALAAGHAVTCLARGGSGPVADGATLVVADRAAPGAYEEVRRRHVDAVVDVSRHPGHVRSAVAALADVPHHVFVSTANVYADHRAPGQDEGAPLLTPQPDADGTGESYGPAKVACERHVLDAVGPGRSLIARAGLIGGPGDTSDRTGYWPWRLAHPSVPDGRVLVPAAEEATQVVDVRDLADWLVRAAAAGLTGTFNAMGPVLTLAEHLEVARSVAGHTGELVRAAPAWLRERGVQPWSGERSLPLWLDDPGWAGFTARAADRAWAAGLVTRPLRETLADVLAWEEGRGGPRASGLPGPQERELLDAWAETAAPR